MPRRSARARSASSPPVVTGPARIKVFLRSLDHRVVDQAAVRLAEVAELGGGRVEGPIPLPSQPSDVEGMRIHTRQIDIVDPSGPLLATLQHFDLPTGVEIEMAG